MRRGKGGTGIRGGGEWEGKEEDVRKGADTDGRNPRIPPFMAAATEPGLV